MSAQLVLESAMDARAVTLEQRRLVHQAVELFGRVMRTGLTPEQCKILAEARGLLQDYTRANDRAAESLRVIAGAVDRIVEGPEWSQRRVVRSTRDHLALLDSPLVSGVQRAQSEAAVRYVIEHAAPEVLAAPRVAHELGARKARLLQRLIDEAKGTAA